MSTDPRTAHVNVFVTKSLEVDEPDWCAGHDNDLAQYKVDISHDGPEHVIAPGGQTMFRAFITQAPFSSVDRTTGLYVETGDFTGTHTPESVEQLADNLIEAAEELRALGRSLAEILTGGENR